MAEKKTTQELDRIAKHGGGKLDSFFGSSI